MEKIHLKTEYITLGQFLKYIGVINSGSEAKVFLSNNEVLINGEIDRRRGRKIYPTNIIYVCNKEYEVL